MHDFFTAFGKLSDSEIQQVIQRFSPIRFEKEEILLKAGEISDKYFILDEGLVRSFVLNSNGEEVTIQFWGGAGVMFEVESFFLRIPTSETLEALTSGNGVYIDFQSLNEMFHTYPGFREIGRTLLVKGFISFKQRTLHLIQPSAEERYVQIMYEHPEWIQLIPLKYLASYLGITDSSLSRIRKGIV